MKRLVVVLTAAALLAGCGGGQQRVLTVAAAASLTEAFTELEKRFETQHPGTDVRINFAGSSELAQQIIAGAAADVFASADQRQMRRVADEGLTATDPRVFATNSLTIAVPRGNPGRIGSFDDLANPRLRLVVCAPQVPCGSAAGKLERAAGVALRPDSEESDVKDVLSKVRTGEADAGLVYETDVRTAGPTVDSIDVPKAAAARNRYPLAILRDASEPGSARDFVALVRDERGRQVLRDAGFGTPWR